MRDWRSTASPMNDRGRPTVRPGARSTGPYVVLDVELRRGAFELVLENIGPEPAHEVRVSFSHPIPGPEGYADLGTLRLFHALGLLRPGRQIRVFVDRAAAVLERGPRCFTAKVSCHDDSGGRLAWEYRHDLTAFADLPEIIND
jgi:hypothetical protein